MINLKWIFTKISMLLDVSYYCIPDSDDLPENIKKSASNLLDAIAAD